MHALHEVFCLLPIGAHHVGTRNAAFHEPSFHDSVPRTLCFELSGLTLIGRCDPSFDVNDDWDSPVIVRFRFVRGRLFACFVLWFLFRCTCPAAAAMSLGAVVVLRVTRVNLHVVGGSVPACFTIRSMLGYSIPSTGIILLTKGSNVEARAAKESTEVFSPLGILVSSNDSNCWAKVLTSTR